MQLMKTALFSFLMFLFQNGQDLYQQALVKERAAGNLEEAIQLYERAAQQAGGDRALTAQALMGAARSYEKLGQAKALALYDELARDYSDQQPALEARQRAADLRNQPGQNAPVLANEAIAETAQVWTRGFASDLTKQIIDSIRNNPNVVEVAPGMYWNRSSLPFSVGRDIQTGVTHAVDGRGRWEIKELDGAYKGRIQIVFYVNGGMSGTNYAYDPLFFRGLTPSQINSPVRTAARFEIVKDAGTFSCEGDFDGGIGRGTFVFQPNPTARGEMLALGFQDFDESQLFQMALQDVGPRFVRELRAAGIDVSTVAQLRRMGIQGVTGEYIREIQQLGYRPNGEELIKMRQQGVTPEFAREVRQMYPSASIQDLIRMRQQGFRPGR